MGRVVPYRRGNRPWRPSDSRRHRAERSRSPFAPVYMLLVISALGLLWYNFGEGMQHRVAHALVGGAVVACGGIAGDTCVVDGDTIEHRGQRIRLTDINTPEIGGHQCARELALGLQAKQRLIELMNQGPFEIVQRDRRDADSWGRKLRVLERDGHSLGARLVDEGLAERWNGHRRDWCG